MFLSQLLPAREPHLRLRRLAAACGRRLGRPASAAGRGGGPDGAGCEGRNTSAGAGAAAAGVRRGVQRQHGRSHIPESQRAGLLGQYLALLCVDSVALSFSQACDGQILALYSRRFKHGTAATARK